MSVHEVCAPRRARTVGPADAVDHHVIAVRHGFVYEIKGWRKELTSAR